MRKKKRTDPELVEKAEREVRGPARELKKRTDHRVERGEVQVPPKERTVLSSRGEPLEAKVEKVLKEVKQRDKRTRRRIERLPDDMVKAKIVDLLAEREHEDWKYSG